MFGTNLDTIPEGIDGQVALDCLHEQLAVIKLPEEAANEVDASYLHSDHMFVRFLIAHSWNATAAAEALQEHYSWLVTRRMSSLLLDPFPELDLIRRYYPQAFHGTDKRGRPIYIERLGYLDVPNIVEFVTIPRLLDYICAGSQKQVCLRLPACSVARGEVIDTSLNILDFEGLSFGLAMNGVARSTMKEILSIQQKHFPGLTGQTVIINAPAVFNAAWAFAKPFLSEQLLSRVSIYGTNKSEIAEALLELVDADQLPALFGGQCVCSGEELTSCMACTGGPWTDPDVLACLCRMPLDQVMTPAGAADAHKLLEQRRSAADQEASEPASASVAAAAPEPAVKPDNAVSSEPVATSVGAAAPELVVTPAAAAPEPAAPEPAVKPDDLATSEPAAAPVAALASSTPAAKDYLRSALVPATSPDGTIHAVSLASDSAATVKVAVCTWNIGDKSGDEAPPAPEKLEWLRLICENAAADLVIIGLQEAAPRHLSSWCAAFHGVMLPGFVPLMSEHSETYMPLFIFANGSSASACKLGAPETLAESLHFGMKDNVASKGCVSGVVHCKDIAFRVINCHLQHAYTGLEKRTQQQLAVEERFASWESLPPESRELPAVLIELGDLNYRLRAEREVTEEPTKSRREGSEHFCSEFERLVAECEAGRAAEKFWPSEEQLSRCRQSGQAFAGFEEAPVTFCPTYKRALSPTADSIGTTRVVYDRSEPRLPGWCDRVLWKKLTPSVNVEAGTYDAVEEVTWTDHRPVFLLLDVSARKS